MATIQRFEDLQSWQKARQLANAVYELTNQSGFAKDFRLRDQIRDAAGSVMHNIAEGFDSGTDPEFIRFLKIARRSASEVQSENCTSRSIISTLHRINSRLHTISLPRLND